MAMLKIFDLVPMYKIIITYKLQSVMYSAIFIKLLFYFKLPSDFAIFYNEKKDK